MRADSVRPDLCEPTRTTEPEGPLILHNNAGPLGTAASLHASNASSTSAPLAAMPNVTLLEAPWANRDAQTNVCWPYPEIVDDYARPLEGPGLGIDARCTSGSASVDEKLAASKPFVPSLQGPRLRGPVEWAGWIGAGFLTRFSR